MSAPVASKGVEVWWNGQMNNIPSLHRTRSIALVVLLLATALVGIVHAAPRAGAAECECVSTSVDTNDSYFPGYVGYRFQWQNPNDVDITGVSVTFDLPTGFEYAWGWPQASFDPSSQALTLLPDGVDTMYPWQETTGYVTLRADKALASSVQTIPYTVTSTDPQGVTHTRQESFTMVFATPAPSYDLRSTTEFSPRSANYGDTVTLTAKLYNDGPGNSGRTYVDIYFDEELTLISPVPADCTLYDEPYEGMRQLDCGGEIDVITPGLAETWTLTLQAPASSTKDHFVAETKIGCNSPVDRDGSDELDPSNDDSSAILTVPPVPTGQLAVVRNLPLFVDDPSVLTNPVAGESMSTSVDVFNAGDADVTGTITVAVAPTAGFTPTSISTDAAGSSCDLSTMTCTFAGPLTPGAKQRIVVVGALDPALADGSTFSSTATATASGFDPASDTASTTISARAEGVVDVSAVTRATPNEEVTVEVTAGDAGPSSMADPVATVTIPSGVRIVSAPDNCTEGGSTLTCPLGDSLAPQEDTSFSFVAGLPDEVGSFDMAVSLSSSTPLAAGSIDSATHTVATDLADGSGVLPYTGSESTNLALVGGVLALTGVAVVGSTSLVRTRRRRS